MDMERIYYLKEYPTKSVLYCKENFEWFVWIDGVWEKRNAPSFDDFIDLEPIDEKTAMEHVKMAQPSIDWRCMIDK